MPDDPTPDNRPQSVRLALEVDERSKISGRHFEDVDVFGPAVCVLVGGKGELDQCEFDAPAPKVFWEIPERDLVGLVRLQDCTFTRCRFHGVAFVGPAATVEGIQSSMAGEEE